MPHLIYSVLALAAAVGTIWVYWGVPRRSVANWATGVGALLAAIGFLLWFLADSAFGITPNSRIFGGIAFGVGISAGGLASYVLYRFALPSGRTGA